MLTVYGEGRGFRVIWLLEELGLTYRLRPVDLLAVENDRDFLAINPAGFIPALQDGETILVESIAILRELAPEAERDARVTCWALETFESRLGLVIRRLADCPYLAGDRFTAADISVSYALLLGLRTGNYVPGPTERDYLARTTARPAYARAMESCQATKAWAARSPGL